MAWAHTPPPTQHTHVHAHPSLPWQVYYSAPLSTVYHVLRTRNAASLYWPLCLMNLVNGSLWTAYGIAVTDYFIWVPNGIGAVLAAFTLVGGVWVRGGRAGVETAGRMQVEYGRGELERLRLRGVCRG